MVNDSAFEILNAPLVRQHLSAIDQKYYSLIREATLEHMSYDPDRNTGNKKPLKRPAQIGVQWELRCGPNYRFRILYQADRVRLEVLILAIGEKRGSRLILGDEEAI
jgi:mRNA-degrading endonuclease RelE of RelBE toxin-antitoxin system